MRHNHRNQIQRKNHDGRASLPRILARDAGVKHIRIDGGHTSPLPLLFTTGRIGMSGIRPKCAFIVKEEYVE